MIALGPRRAPSGAAAAKDFQQRLEEAAARYAAAQGQAQGQSALRNGYFGAGSSLLNGAGSLAKGFGAPAPLRAGTTAAARGIGQGLLGADDYGATTPYIRSGI